MPVQEHITIEEQEAQQASLKKSQEKPWNPTEPQKAHVKFVYETRYDMQEKRRQHYPQFNDRTLKQFIDDSEKRMNAYVLDRASQGKEDWQSNYATRVYANKAKALLAATAKQLPDIRFKAVNTNDQFDYFAGDMIGKLVRHSYNQGNPQEDMFFLAWSNIGKGTVLSYEGYERQDFIKHRIKSFDMLTGDVESEEVESSSEGEPISFEIPLMDVLISNFYIRDIQQQPVIIWETYYEDRSRFKADWGQYPNAGAVPDVSDLTTSSDNDTYFYKKYKGSAKDGKGYVVSRLMSVYSDVYRVIANGVELYNGPMPWISVTRKNFGRKVYPIAKTIYEPFANTNFFYGNSMPNTAMGEGDTLNTLYNSSLDKQYRSLVPPLLVGQVNKDMLDLENEVVAGDTKIYVEDINQVKQMDLRGVSDSDVKMIDLISSGIDLTTLDPQQQGSADRYVTARAAVAADERARQLKGIFFMFMESLWLQKFRLRTANVLLSYTRPKLTKIIGKEGAEEFISGMRTMNIDNETLSDGSKGTLAVQFQEREKMDKSAIALDIEAEEERAVIAGENLEKVVMPFDYLEKFSYDVEIISETLFQSSQAVGMAMVIEKIGVVSKMFPEIFSENKEVFFTDLVKNYSDDIRKYKIPSMMNFEDEKSMELAMSQKTPPSQRETPATSKRVGDINEAGTGRLSDVVEQ